jgi:hypothetical protein
MGKNAFNQRGVVLRQSSSHCVQPDSGVPQALFRCNEMGNIILWSSIAISVFLPILVYIQLIFGVGNKVSFFINVLK